jgi:phosphatidylserine/phosphatidylglycerophosphate/cardiolipin synthase-like enzyme
MPVTLRVYADEDDALLFWSIPAPIPGCRGFAVEKRRNGKVETLVNRVGFAEEADHGRSVIDQHAPTQPSTVWPFQRFSWTDHGNATGDTIAYRVIPVIRTDAGTLVAQDAAASEWSADRKLGDTQGQAYKAFFNRGFVMSQFMARYLQESGKTLKQFKDTISDADDKSIRTFLSGDLRLAMIDQLAQAKKDGGHIYAALFELNDQDLVRPLAALGKHAHVVLANGSVKRRGEDENADAREALNKAHVEVHDRMTAPGPLAHNKFLVRTDKSGTPVVAWTGSTNWTSTGLCTQLNNGLLIEDADVAQVYLDQWNRLVEAGDKFPADLVEQNDIPAPVGKDVAGQIRATVWFSRTHMQVDLDALNDEVRRARDGILFLMFMPGSAGLFSTVAARSSEPNLYVRGVASELPRGRDDASEVDVNLIDNDKHTPLHLDMIQPEGVAHPLAYFAAEVTRKQFLGNIGYAIIHSKVVVLDPFGADPVVITGSHNFSGSASSKNDENFIIVKGNRPLAEAYAVNIIAAWDHYRWRAQLAKAARPFNGLSDSDTWQAPMLEADRKDLRFWGV